MVSSIALLSSGEVLPDLSPRRTRRSAAEFKIRVRASDGRCVLVHCIWAKLEQIRVVLETIHTDWCGLVQSLTGRIVRFFIRILRRIAARWRERERMGPRTAAGRLRRRAE